MSSRIVIKSEHERLVYGEIYAPYHVDTDNEMMTKEDIKKAAHNFLIEGRTSKIDVQHNYRESGCVVVESFLARKNDPDGFVEGSWVLGVKILPDELWNKILKGELNGFSFGAEAKKIDVKAKVKIAKKMIGETEESLIDTVPEHFHSISLEFNGDGKLISGYTGEAYGHVHEVIKSTATEKILNHSHRLILIENESE